MNDKPVIHLGGTILVPDPSGALWWPETATLIVADLHLEKGASFARAGSLLPPYDTRTTLNRLADRIADLVPTRIVALGDSFHRADSADFLDEADAELLASLTAKAEWFWLAGNHDPQPPASRLGGAVVTGDWRLGPLMLRHEAVMGCADDAEISGHYHPKARLRLHGRSASYRCFVADARRLVLPAFGAYAGGLEVSDLALRTLFGQGFTAYLVGRRKVTAVPHHLLLPELLPA
ncbi:MAG TPA: ligase-associated DNA damage response endonuclease PdeM [Stellaceae bacterium]|nr:ligase-associated DNA damage response endonuclease PdeM [Stellaceae bacterium]